MSEDNKTNSKSKNNKVARVILIIIAVAMIICGAVYFGYYLYSSHNAKDGEKQLSSVAQTTQITDSNKVKNPIDFDTLQKGNTDIYAWIKVPNTKVDYPVVQSPTDDEFYLRHNALNKEWLASGAIYTQSMNSKDFKDPVTVIYGHNNYGDSMFTTLHKFEDQQFFNDNTKFYIYTTNSKLTYKVVSAFKYDDRHIMNSFDFQDEDIFTNFLDMIQNPNTTNKNVCKTLDKPLTKHDNIVILSTCITSQPSSRYLICGVLVNNEETN